MGTGEERIGARLDILREIKEELFYRDLDLFRKMMNKHLKEYLLFKSFDDYLIRELGLELDINELIGKEGTFYFKVDSFYHESDYGDIVSMKDMLDAMCEEFPTLEPIITLYDCVSEFDSFFIKDEVTHDNKAYITLKITFIDPL